MRVVTVDAPRLQGAIHDEVVSGTAHVVHDFFATVFLKCLAHALAESLQHLVPGSAGPLPSTARAGALHGIEDAIGIVNLGDGGRAFRAQAPAAGGMLGITFKLRDLSGSLIDIGKKAAGGLTVEADGGNELIMLFDAAGPRFGIVLNPIVPLLDRRTKGKVAAVALKIGHC